MISPSDLDAVLKALAPPSVLTGCRLIEDGDETSLFPVEAAALRKFPVATRRASGAARRVARDLLAQFGYQDCPLPRSAGGAPTWPRGVVGSLAHDHQFVVAAVGSSRELAGLGIDVEPAEELPHELVPVVCTPRERAMIAGHALAGRALFAAKEAVYKAVNPIDGVFLEHHDVEVELARDLAVVRGGRTVTLRWAYSPRILAIAVAT